MGREEKFIQLYNEIDRWLREETKSGGGTSFPHVVDRARRKNPVVRRHAQDLKDYAQLRNVIVHYKTYPEMALAEPSEQALAEFEHVVRNIISPARLLPAFQKKVRCFSPFEPLSEALEYMGQNDYSQIIVFRNGKIFMLTTDGVARWLESQVDEDIISVKEATIQDALECEQNRTFRMMDRNASVYEAHEAFARAIEKKTPRLFAIVITEKGDRSETPLGLVTPWDLLDTLNNNG